MRYRKEVQAREVAHVVLASAEVRKNLSCARMYRRRGPLWGPERAHALRRALLWRAVVRDMRRIVTTA